MESDDLDIQQLKIYLEELSDATMPFGRFGPKDYPPRGVPLVDLPLEYLVWFSERGFPQGRLGELMTFTYEIKSVGAEEIFAPIRKKNNGRTPLQKPRKPRSLS